MIAKYLGAAAAALCLAGAATAQYGPNGQYSVAPQPVYPSVYWSSNYIPAPYSAPVYGNVVRTGGFAGRAFNNGGYTNNGYTGGYYARPYGWNNNYGRRGWNR